MNTREKLPWNNLDILAKFDKYSNVQEFSDFLESVQLQIVVWVTNFSRGMEVR